VGVWVGVWAQNYEPPLLRLRKNREIYGFPTVSGKHCPKSQTPSYGSIECLGQLAQGRPREVFLDYGRNLPAADTRYGLGIGPSVSSDPYVIFRLGGTNAPGLERRSRNASFGITKI